MPRTRVALWGVIFLIALGTAVLLEVDKATATCRPPLTTTTTDYNRLTEATDDFIEVNYLMVNVTWNVLSVERARPSDVVASIAVGPMITEGHPGALLINRSKAYRIELSRACAADPWTVESFERK